MANHVFANRGFGDLDAELQELAVNSRRSPAQIVSAESPNQFTCFLWDTWSAWGPCRTFQVQYQRKPRRCQSITVAAFTIQRASRHRDQNWDNATQKRRSTGFSLGLGFSR